MQTISELVKQAENYWAHLPARSSEQKEETLEEHSLLVLGYTKKIIDEHGLKSVIHKLIKDSFELNWTDAMVHKVYDLFLESILLHDLGKINPNFQVRKMRNQNFTNKELEFGSDHALPGYVLFMQNKFHDAMEIPEEQMEESEIFLVFVCLFGFQIAKHHASFMDNVVPYLQYKFDCSDEDVIRYIDDVIQLLDSTNFKEHSELQIKETGSLGDIVKETLKEFSKNSFPLFALLKLHYSLLTASDYLATTHYMNNWDGYLTDYGTIGEELKSRIVNSVRSTRLYNKKVFKVLENYQFTYPTEQSNENLNRLRQELSIEVIQNIRKNSDKKVFYIEAPTGGGKTNLSMLAAAELLAQNTEVNNLFYVFPFTTLITQTYDALKETMGLTEDEIIQLHSKEGFKEKSDGDYGKDKKNHIDYLFINYPVVLMSHVKFFDTLKTNGKESNYLLHRLANSIVVVDELQSYPPKIWDKLIFFIQQYAEYFNIRFILMSATLPKLDKLSNVATDICYLTNNKDKFFQNPNFCNRVEFDFSLLEWKTPDKEDKLDYLNKLGAMVIEKSKDYSFCNAKYPDSVFTIIEFIYKQTATEFYSIISDLHEGFFDEIFVLSGTILEPRRKQIIQYLKDINNRDKKVILITTQVVEAGVDIDMDLGFKDKSLVDSDEQLAGRINRNVNKPACKLYLFDCDNAEVIYKGDERFKLLQNELYGLDKEILQTKEFDRMYDEVMNTINKKNNRTYQQNFVDFESYLKRLDFQEINLDFKIINQQSTSVFVPVDLPVFVPGTECKERNFSEKELVFLQEKGIANTNENVIDGEKVFELYVSLIRAKQDDFILARTEIKKLQGIMSKFIFSLMTNSKSLKKLIEEARGEERMGMYYLSHWEEDGVYDINFGLVEKENAAIIL